MLVIAGVWLAWYFAYGLHDEPPGNVQLQGVRAPVQIDWHEEGYPVVQAQSEADAIAALGYAQGLKNGWTILLLRQTALGRQAEWFGDDLLTLDRFVRRLELAYTARQAYDSLSTEGKRLLAAYTTGLNAALRSRNVRVSDELSLFHIEPEPWEPWHTLAVERLYAWLASPPPTPDTLKLLNADAQSFFKSDALLRQWLHLHGFQNSMALAYADSQATHFFERQVYGSSASMPFSEAVLQWPGRTIAGASIPGTPFFPAGKSNARVWALLPRGTVRLIRTLDDTTLSRPRYERLVSKEGVEELLALKRKGNTIYFEPPPRPPAARPDSAAFPRDSAGTDTLGSLALSVDSLTTMGADTIRVGPDSTWALRWTGFSASSDFAAWHALESGEPPGFSLLRPAGLSMDSTGQWQVIGRPSVVVSLTRGILVGNSEWARFVAQAFDSLLVRSETPPSVAEATTDYRSEWAAALAPRMIASIDSIPNRVPLVNEALTYLQNWDFNYDRASIAASIFDTWVSVYAEQTGHNPRTNLADSLFFENLVRYQALGKAVSTLRQQFGDNLSRWRWENVNPDRRFFPVWSADTLIDRHTGRFAQTRYAPLVLPGRGHPSTLFWGSSPVQQQSSSPAAWAAWTNTNMWDRLFVRRLQVDLSTPLGRYRTSDRVPAPIVLSPGGPSVATTTLTPSQAQP